MTGALDFTRRLENAGIAFLQHEPLASHTTFKIGGPAHWFCEPDSEVKLREVLQLCRENNIRFYLLGKGSNILFADEGFDGAVIHIGAAMADIRVEGNRICAQAGAKLADVCRAAADAGLSGLEFEMCIRDRPQPCPETGSHRRAGDGDHDGGRADKNGTCDAVSQIARAARACGFHPEKTAHGETAVCL